MCNRHYYLAKSVRILDIDSLVHNGCSTPAIAVFLFLFSFLLSLDTQKSKAPRRTDPAEEFLKLYGQSQPSSDNHNSPTQTVVELKQEIKDLKEENAKLKEIVLQGIIDSYQILNHQTSNKPFSK